MRFRDVIKLTAGSCLIYFVIAACSAYTSDDEAKKAAQAGPDGAASTSPTAPPPSMTSPVPSAFADGQKSGTRLKLRFYEGSDGSRILINLFDTELKTPCDVSTGTSDLKLRCVPAAVGQVYYSDTGCTTPTLYGVDKTTDPQPTVGVGRTAGVTSNDYYRLGALVTPPAMVYQSRFGAGDCSGNAPFAQYNYYTLAAPLPATAFVEMTVKTE